MRLKLGGGCFDASELEMCVPGDRHLSTQNLKANLYLQTLSDPMESHPVMMQKESNYLAYSVHHVLGTLY